MPTARVLADQGTREFPVIDVSVGSRDPIDGLVDDVRPLVERAVETLQLAAWLEANGVTDRGARSRFGLRDVFELADELRRRVGRDGDPDPGPARTAPRATRALRDVGHGLISVFRGVSDRVARSRFGLRDVFKRADQPRRRVGRHRDPDPGRAHVAPRAAPAWRDIGHGLISVFHGVADRVVRSRFGLRVVVKLADGLRRRVGPDGDRGPASAAGRTASAWRFIGHSLIYLFPAVLFPEAIVALRGSWSLAAVVATGAVGWVFSGVIAWLAYRLLGEGYPGSAGRLLRWACLSAPVLGGLTAASVTLMATGVGAGVLLLSALAMAYQMAATALVIYGRELLVLAAMAPAPVAAVVYIVIGPTALPVSVAAAVTSIACVLGLAVRETFRRGAARTRARDTMRRSWRGMVAVTAFTTASAGFFLSPQVSNLAHGVDLAVALAVLPMVAGMGVVEWQAIRLRYRGRALLQRLAHPRQFGPRIWLAVLCGLAVCLAVVGGLTAALLGVLAATGHYTQAGAAMAAAFIPLTGAFYLGFPLANMGCYGWLCGSLLAGLASYEVIRFAWPGPFADARAFGIGAELILLLYLIGLLGRLDQAVHHR
jgi:hypothetical protein